MSAHHDRHTRTDYTSLNHALVDAERVLDELVLAIHAPGQLLVDPAALEFLARRSRQLVIAARTATTQAGTR